jgi:hypothetical protein
VASAGVKSAAVGWERRVGVGRRGANSAPTASAGKLVASSDSISGGGALEWRSEAEANFENWGAGREK